MTGILTCCSGGDEVIKGKGETMAAYTMAAVLTQSAYETVSAKLTEVTIKMTTNPESTATPVSTPTPNVTQTNVTALSPTAVATTRSTCNRAEFVADVTVPDGTGLNANYTFTKTWRIKNVGTCTWNSSYKLIYSGGELMGADEEIPLSINVPPGQSVDVSVDMKTPNLAGKYTSYWMLESDKKEVFGSGNNNTSLYAQIVVGSGTSRTNTSFYMAANACLGSWYSSSGAVACPSTSTTNGGVTVVTSFVMEGGYSKSSPSILMTAPSTSGKTITGQFPAYQVKETDHFVTKIGCVDGYPDCNITFYVSYLSSDGVTHSLGSWGHTEDAYTDDLSIDLSSLAGTTIQMIFTVSNNASNTDGHGFFLYPIIEPE